MKPVTAVMIGAGNRAAVDIAPYATKFPDEMKYVAVVQRSPARREKFAQDYDIPPHMCFDSLEAFYAADKLADCVVIGTHDRLHYEPTMKSIEKGYHVLLEKPMSHDPLEVKLICQAAADSGVVVSVFHGMRFLPQMQRIKSVIDSGAIGEVTGIVLNGSIAWWHYAHSFVRGRANDYKTGTPIILYKCCHDLDLISWLLGKDCKRVSSFGDLTYFKFENAPGKDVPERCTDGCPYEEKCQYHAPKWYLGGNAYWTTDMLALVPTEENWQKALVEGPYGRCVYRCENNVCDKQIVNMEFEGGVLATYEFTGFDSSGYRSVSIMGTKGQIQTVDHDRFELHDFLSRTHSTYDTSDGYSNTDFMLIRDFIRAVRSEGKIKCKTSAEFSLQGHMIAFAAEKSRVEGNVVDFEKYLDSVK